MQKRITRRGQEDAAKPLANHKNWRIQAQNQQQEALNGRLRQAGCRGPIPKPSMIARAEGNPGKRPLNRNEPQPR
ncbi:MAG TPA: hypothetical protein VGT81_12155, partial [Casimicrobiaceae bacterium]|nr:hypothetical protein [Casimicrobiaceae bacterium]